MSQLKERKSKGQQPAAPSGPHEEKHPMEFGGPLGAIGVSFGLPILVYVFAFFINEVSGCPPPSVLQPKTFSLEKLKYEVGWQGFSGLINLPAFGATVAYYVWSLFLNRVLPATVVEGVQLRSGGRLKYRFNAFSSALVTLALLGVGTFFYGAKFPVWTFIWDNYIPILTSNIIISYALATFVYVRSFEVRPGNKENRELAAGGHSGNMLYDWFIGRELNPRVSLPFFGDIDIKAFMELRPGMLGWLILDLAFIAHQYNNYGKVTASILMVTFVQGFYVLDALYMEPAILTTMDIIMDGFGFMLSFGDLVWVPFVFSLQARYLSIDPKVLTWPEIGTILAVQGFGYYIFRSSNNEKNRFRTNPEDPKVKHLKYMETSAGSKLLISGWWGTARHINYLGDWFMSWSYCLPTGIAGYVFVNHSNIEVVPGEARGWGMLITYFYMIYFAVLLIHREGRDEEKCKKKYGKDWDEYCKKVPYRIVPYVY
ncbi:Ergosterol biosynthesis ERG4/ERG24 [Macrophomina phaseolina MS6]|uniref:Delta(14)-sterol reductase n=1 Tax=Macrophomina phaseolina (strain MS6) TaxID=1126212 RepID=K2RX69_MACPH|nr:Ergosterol biosynthesis ERG4/ERG24 [Macrophomina phaseolina MS6]